MPLFLTLLTLVVLFVSVCHGPAFPAAAGNPPYQGYQEGLACPYKGKLILRARRKSVRTLIRSAAWLHSNLTVLWKFITIAFISHTTRISSAVAFSHGHACTFLIGGTHASLSEGICSTYWSSQG